MELVPILATIILVSTISTFILAIGAYVLYKVRERRGRRVEVAQPSKIQAELLTPEMQERTYTQDMQIPSGQIMQDVPVYHNQEEPILIKSRATMPQPVQARVSPAQQYVNPQQTSVRKKTTEQKFLKVTSEGYQPVKEGKKEQGPLKWR